MGLFVILTSFTLATISGNEFEASSINFNVSSGLGTSSIVSNFSIASNVFPVSEDTFEGDSLFLLQAEKNVPAKKILIAAKIETTDFNLKKLLPFKY